MIKRPTATGCNSAVLGIPPVLRDENTLLKKIKTNAHKARFDPCIAATIGTIPFKTRSAKVKTTPIGLPKAL